MSLGCCMERMRIGRQEGGRCVPGLLYREDEERQAGRREVCPWAAGEIAEQLPSYPEVLWWWLWGGGGRGLTTAYNFITPTPPPLQAGSCLGAGGYCVKL